MVTIIHPTFKLILITQDGKILTVKQKFIIINTIMYFSNIVYTVVYIFYNESRINKDLQVYCIIIAEL